jgi:2-C-methyl-D-erythritol 4-phosphate cytidylyltransferase
MGDRYWVVIPAAGRGERFGSALPKQYAMLAGRTVIERAVACFEGMAGLAGVVIAIAEEDTQVHMSYTPGVPVESVTGGETRAASVMSALDWLYRGPADATDWVLVHDAARPLLGTADRDALVAACTADGDGGLLAVPVTDTLKQADEAGRVTGTVPRRALWRALTPQMFRLGPLRDALAAAGPEVTDESSAMEQAGFRPVIVTGSALNIKITTTEDMKMAQVLLEHEEAG